MSMDISYGIDTQRKEMKRRAMAEIFWRPGVLGADLIGDLNAMFHRPDAQEVLWELIGGNVVILSAEGKLWLASGWRPE